LDWGFGLDSKDVKIVSFYGKNTRQLRKNSAIVAFGPFKINGFAVQQNYTVPLFLQFGFFSKT
jgi:hypothetical protein